MADEEKLRQYLKKATGELQQTARRLRDVELRDSEPIAIVGMGCVFPPGLRSPAELWRFVVGEGDGISSFPDDRGWDSGPAAGRGGFIAGADLFDAGFFGIGEHEALAMDPQQRLLLEVAWSALEDAGLDPVGLRGSQTGVYAGVSYCDYGAGSREALPTAVADQLVIGSSPSTASGRISHTLGLRGPAVSIDTACSSALVAIHLACQALRRGDCELALAGGVTVMATPRVLEEFSRRGALAADGRCKPFADAADGMGFGEGAGLLALERLSVARRAGHPVLAVIRGTAINQDGATNGMTSPSRSAQEDVIRRALANAGLTPDQVDAVEGHGTGTALGDSIEAEALIAVYGAGRAPERPLLLGSVKSNIGHTQTASGVAGVIKTVMSMRAGLHARTLHVDRPSGYVDWSDGTVAVTAKAVAWEAAGTVRRAGVSSFGISGTNAHVIVEEVPQAEQGMDAGAHHAAARSVLPWVLSAKTEPALRAMAAELRDFLATSSATVAEVGISLAARSMFKYRAVIVAASIEEHLAALAALARGEDAPGLHTGAAAAAKTAVIFVNCEPGSAAAEHLLNACGVTPDLVAGDFLPSDADEVRSEVLARGATSVLELDPDVSADELVARLAVAYTAGTSVSWQAVYAGSGAGKIRLPGYPFQRRRYWLDLPSGRPTARTVLQLHSATDLEALRARMSEHDLETLLARLGAAGTARGPVLRQVVRGLWRAESEVLALVETDPDPAAETELHLLDPVVLEACFLAALPLVAGGVDQAWRPSSLSGLTRHRALPHRLWCHARRIPDGSIDVDLRSDSGDLLASITGLVYGAVDLPASAEYTESLADIESWDVAELSRLAVEDPQAARETFTDILFTRVTALVEGLDDDHRDHGDPHATLRSRFPDLRLGDLGLDSLRAMRLREQLRAVLSVDVPPQRLLGDTSVADVVDLVCRSLAARSLVATGDEQPAAAGEIEELIL